MTDTVATRLLNPTYKVAIVGAGFAGLGTAAALRANGIADFVLFEAGARAGHAWVDRYDRLHLHSPFHDMPKDGGMRADYPMFIPARQMAEYLQRYAALHGIDAQVRSATRVLRIEYKSDSTGWRLQTSAGDIEADYVAVATAINRVPIVPTIAESERFGGALMHSATYRNAAPFAGKSVLVVGSGNSAAEIALDLTQNGARRTVMWVRGPRHFIPRAVMGGFFRLMRLLGQMNSASNDVAHRISVGTPAFERIAVNRDRLMGRFSADLARFGIRKPRLGPALEVALNARIPTFDVGAIAAIRSKQIEVIDGNVRPLHAFTPKGMQIGDREEAFDAVILATGFRPGLEEFIADEALLGPVRNWPANFPLTNDRCRSRVIPSIFFPGFDPTPIGGLSLGRWGWETGERIAAELHR